MNTNDDEPKNKAKTIAFTFFILGVLLLLTAVTFTLAAIWMSGNHHGLGGKLAGTCVVFYILGIPSTLAGAYHTWDWDWS